MALQLNRLVTEKWVDGWDDPRLLTLAGLRRRGVSSTAINSFIRGIGITRRFEMHLPYCIFLWFFIVHICSLVA
jgi:glutamyl/glutaminyl-tRNA synthetase